MNENYEDLVNDLKNKYEKVTIADINHESTIPFLGILSDNLRLSLKQYPKLVDKFLRLMQKTIEDVVPLAGESLKKETITGIVAAVRQCDLIHTDGSILFKTYITWRKKEQSWLIMVEGANETFWQDKFKVVGKG